ncbi:MAG TPA: phospholipase D-like domain-containing protein [Terriglobales bacterium]|nr:phospholipase D-like domain-containing protein [Terriglobales bacterium]
MSHTLLVMPDDTVQPILEAIHGAKKSIRVKMFLFSHPELLNAVIEAKKRGVHVRVMLNPARRTGKPENRTTRMKLKAAGLEVIDSNPHFEVTHEKSMVVDDEIAYIKSFNWDVKDLTQTRDYAVVTTHAPEVAEVIRCFEADWERKPFIVDDDALLIWCTANGRDRIARFIDSAQHTLFAQNERYQDSVIIERLVRAKMRGVKVHVMARPPHKLKKEKLTEGVGGLRIMNDVGIKVHKLKHRKLHGKMLLADHSRAIVGSINLAPGSFDSRRELAIEVHSPDVVERLCDIVRDDWEHSHPLDLTDEGLLAELEEHKIAAAEELALERTEKKDRGRH